MGQRLIITEEEKNRIKLLYEVTETKTSVPPDESELVVKGVNPFKSGEYIDARREYSPELKDGDRYYVFHEYSFTSGLEYELKQLVNNKSIRIGGLVDKILTVQVQHVFLDHNKIYLLLRTPDSYRSISVTITPTEIELGIEVEDRHKNDYLSSLQNYATFVRNEMKKYLEMYSKYIKQKTDLQDVPDKYFDIYKIKRRQTDF
jgi:hypothetical protein